LVAERKEKSYNYYAIVIPDSIILLWFTGALTGAGLEAATASVNGGIEGLAHSLDIVLLVLLTMGWSVQIQARTLLTTR